MIPDAQLDLWGEKIIESLKGGDQQERAYLKFVKNCAIRISENKDAVICVCGERGMGKSSFAVLTALCLRKYGMKFDFGNLFYGPDCLEDAINRIVSTRKSVFIFDEMIDFAYSRDAMSSLNKNIAKLLTKSRKLNHIFFFCIPRFRNLDTTIRNDVVHYWIEVYWKSEAGRHHDRFALAGFFRKDRNPLAEDPWGISGMREERLRVYTPRDQLRLMKKIRSFLCSLRYPPLPVVIEEKYEEMSRKTLRESGAEIYNSIMKGKKKQINNTTADPNVSGIAPREATDGIR